MSNYFGIPILALAAVLNATVMAELRLGGGAPDLVFLLVVCWALLMDVRGALVWAVVGGVMQDMLSVAPLGASSLGLVIVVFAIDSLLAPDDRVSLVAPPVVAAGGTLVYHLALLIVLRMFGEVAVPVGQGLYYVTVPSMIYNTLLILPTLRIMAAIYRGSQPQRPRLE
jgi:rod shape-determining protein MreD